MTIEEALKGASHQIRQISSTPMLDAELLLAYVLKKNKEYLFSHPEENLPRKFLSEFRALVAKRLKKTPVAYLTKHQEFYGIDFYVDKHVLIPRPETEQLVDDVLDTVKKLPGIKLIIDIGTGSGCIAAAVAKNSTNIEILGLEISPKAIVVAKKNIKKLQLEKNVTILKSDLLSKLPKKYLKAKKIIAANLPYIGTEKNNFIADDVKMHEPKVALFGGKDGLTLYEKLLKQIVSKKIPFEMMFFEIGFSQVEDIEKLIKKYLPRSPFRILKDLAGFPRTVKISK